MVSSDIEPRPRASKRDLFRRKRGCVFVLTRQCGCEMVRIVREDLSVVARPRSRDVSQRFVDQRPDAAVAGIDVDERSVDGRALRGVGRHRVGVVEVFVVLQIPADSAARIVQLDRDVAVFVEAGDRAEVAAADRFLFPGRRELDAFAFGKGTYFRSVDGDAFHA